MDILILSTFAFKARTTYNVKSWNVSCKLEWRGQASNLPFFNDRLDHLKFYYIRKLFWENLEGAGGEGGGRGDWDGEHM